VARCWHSFPGPVMGRAWQLCPGTSDIDFLCDLKGVIELDAQIANRALDLRLPVRRQIKVALVRRIECVANFNGSRPMLLTHRETSRANWRVVRDRSGPPPPATAVSCR
jgi:hypothetical protein